VTTGCAAGQACIAEHCDNTGWKQGITLANGLMINAGAAYKADASYITVPAGWRAVLKASNGDTQTVEPGATFDFCSKGGFNDATVSMTFTSVTTCAGLQAGLVAMTYRNGDRLLEMGNNQGMLKDWCGISIYNQGQPVTQYGSTSDRAPGVTMATGAIFLPSAFSPKAFAVMLSTEGKYYCYTCPTGSNSWRECPENAGKYDAFFVQTPTYAKGVAIANNEFTQISTAGVCVVNADGTAKGPCSAAPQPQCASSSSSSARCSAMRQIHNSNIPYPYCPPSVRQYPGQPGRCWVTSLEAAQAQCNADVACCGITKDAMGWEMRMATPGKTCAQSVEGWNGFTSWGCGW